VISSDILRITTEKVGFFGAGWCPGDFLLMGAIVMLGQLVAVCSDFWKLSLRAVGRMRRADLLWFTMRVKMFFNPIVVIRKL
jgi:hypothetical protein